MSSSLNPSGSSNRLASLAHSPSVERKAPPSEPIIKKIQQHIRDGTVFYSFEFFPPKTQAGVTNLFARLERMAALEPLFMDVTWGAGGSTAELTLDITGTAQHISSTEMMMHLSCTNMTKQKIKDALDRCVANGVRNILALRGDPMRGADTWEPCDDGFSYALELVHFIRQEYKDYFGIAVAGYPEGHIAAKSLEEDILHLKAKVDAGADFIITQLFYDVDIFLAWVKKCREAGITCPIIPGVMPIQDYNGFKRMTGFCKTHVPDDILLALEPIKNDDARVKAFGIELGAKMCRKLLLNGVPGIHFYTLNLEKSVASILELLGYVTFSKAGQLPWAQSLVSRRHKEDVRPIFWANRPKSYLDRTTSWDDFPNGRWGDSRSPAFGDLSDYHLFSLRIGSVNERRRLWGYAPTKPNDIFGVFERYITGQISKLPWCEFPVNLETMPLQPVLKRMNHHGFLTINSQPRVNGEKSTDPAVGWGGPGGYVYQKAYLEFFTSQGNLEKLSKLATEFPSLTYMATNVKGERVTNLKFDAKGAVNAVTWGVFPNQEIIQPTVVDPNSFMVWKDEAFALWKSQWQVIYEKGSPSWELIQEIHDTYYLVNVVDNDYVTGDIFAFFEKIMA